MTPKQARQVLNAPLPCDAAELGRAFRRAVKAAHPDVGGTAERLRLVIEAHDLLKAVVPAATPSQPRAGAAESLEITVTEALLGGERRVHSGGAAWSVRLPPGLRSGESLRVAGDGGAELLLRISIADTPSLMVRGDDLWMRRPVSDGAARLELDTPRGRRSVWLSRKVGSKRLLRLTGEGLPARAGRPAGDLIIRLETAPAAESPARQMLRRFAGAWAPSDPGAARA